MMIDLKRYERTYRTSADLLDAAMKATEDGIADEDGGVLDIIGFGMEALENANMLIAYHNANVMPHRRFSNLSDLNWYLAAKILLVYYSISAVSKGHWNKVERVMVVPNIDENDVTIEMSPQDYERFIRRECRKLNPMFSEFDIRSILCFLEDNTHYATACESPTNPL